MSEVIVVTSGKGGVGKTTTTANIGTGLAKLGKKVVMIDTDTGLRNLDVVLGLENRIVYNLVDVVEGNCRLKQAMIADKRCPNLFLLPTAQTRDKSAVTPEQMIKVIDEIKNDPEGFDYIILDCPAGIEQGFQNAIAGADRALVVTTPEVSAIRDADRIVGLLDAHGLQNHEDLIVNRIRMDMVNRGEMMSIDDVNDILQLNVIGAVPDHTFCRCRQGYRFARSKCHFCLIQRHAFFHECSQAIISGANRNIIPLCLRTSIVGRF